MCKLFNTRNCPCAYLNLTPKSLRARLLPVWKINCFALYYLHAYFHT